MRYQMHKRMNKASNMSCWYDLWSLCDVDVEVGIAAGSIALLIQ